MQEQDIPTPAVIFDVAQASRNTRRLVEYLRGHGMKLRPHTKTHKSARLGALQIEWGAEGLAVAKLGEAEVMARVTDDVLVGYPALDPARTAAAARLARQVNLRVAVDSRYAADALASAARQAGSTIGILVDLDVGLRRTGVQGPEDALALAQHVDATNGLRLNGLFYYPGHVRCGVDKQQPMLEDVEQQLEETLDLWARHGLEARIVSGGSTPTQFQSHHVPATTEVRAGTSLVFDRIYFLYGFCQREDIAARIVATVVSNAAPGKAVIDSGTTCDTCKTGRIIHPKWTHLHKRSSLRAAALQPSTVPGIRVPTQSQYSFQPALKSMGARRFRDERAPGLRDGRDGDRLQAGGDNGRPVQARYPDGQPARMVREASGERHEDPSELPWMAPL